MNFNKYISKYNQHLENVKNQKKLKLIIYKVNK